MKEITKILNKIEGISYHAIPSLAAVEKELEELMVTKQKEAFETGWDHGVEYCDSTVLAELRDKDWNYYLENNIK